MSAEEMEENDDEAERQELRRQKQEAAKKALMASPYKENRKASGISQSEDQLFQKLSSTISLCTENKINSANSFNTELIENLHMAVGMDETETNFQQASCALDAGVKIYEKRVDNVHQSTLKMLGGINRADVDGDGNEEDDDGGDAEESEVVTKKVRRKKASNVATIETNVDNINLPREERAKVFDPLFHMMAGKFDEGGARGLLLHNLNVSMSGGLVFDSMPPADMDGADTLGEESMESFVSESLLGKLQAISISSKRELCPEFDSYKRTVESELDREPTEQNNTEEAPDIDSDPEDNDFDHDDDIADDMPMSFGDEGADDYSQPLQQGQSLEGDLARPSWNQMQCALEDGINFSDDYSFFTKKMQSSWAGGAGQWKPSTLRAKDDGKKKKGEKVTMTIDFTTVHEMDFGTSFDMPSRAGADRLSDNAIEKSLESASTLLLPSDHQYQPEQLLSLFLRPKKRVNRFKSTMKLSSTEGEQAYNYSNSADGNYIVPQDFDEDDHGGFDDHDDDDMGGMGEGGTGFELVAEPTKVAKIDVHFERVAKKLDVKALKQSMWGRIEEQEEDKAVDAPKLFTEVLKDIPKIVPEEMTSTVSVPYCFICLLHLANEKTLELNDVQDLSELTIKMAA